MTSDTRIFGSLRTQKSQENTLRELSRSVRLQLHLCEGWRLRVRWEETSRLVSRPRLICCADWATDFRMSSRSACTYVASLK
eukprot:765260-Hanusia_phi.AAC.8